MSEENNVMRQQYKKLTEDDQNKMLNVKKLGREFYKYIDSLEPSRENSIAKTKIEEAVMWAVKAITS